MRIEPIGFIVLALALVCLCLKPKWTIVVMVCLTPIGAAGAMTLPGGANIAPGNLFLPFAAFKVLNECPSYKTVLNSFLKDVSGVLLFLLVLLGLFSAMVYPFVFTGVTDVVSTNRFGDSDSKFPVAERLSFHSGYLTQPVYAIGFLGVFVICYVASKRGYGAGAFFRGLKTAAILNLGMVVFDVFATVIGKPELLEPLRASGYASGEQEMAGFKRLNGAFTEPSALATYTLQLAAPLFYLWWRKSGERVSLVLALLLLLTIALCTSSTGYVATSACVLLLVLLTAIELVSTHVAQQMRKRLGQFANFASLVGCSFAALVLVILLTPDALASVEEILRHTLFEKADSESGLERGFWATQAIQNCFDTYGLGVGLGGARSNSFALVLLSNVGIPGLLIAIAFFGSLFIRILPSDATEDESRAAILCKGTIVGCLAAVNVSGAVFDIGLLVYIAAGTLAGLRCKPRGVHGL